MSTKATSQSVEFDQLFLEAGQCGETAQQHGNSAVAGRPIIIGAKIKPSAGYEEKTPVAIDRTILMIVDDRGMQSLNFMELR